MFLFGSRAAGTAKLKSDFDIGVMGDKKLPIDLFYKIEDMLDSIKTLYRLELIDFWNVSPAFKKQALKQIEVLL
ncbi:MAG: nucleotidyltransferase domain-containing protein [bacterium]